MPQKLHRRLKSFFVDRRDLHSCRVYRSTNQSIPDATETAIIFDNQRFDTSPNDDIWSAGQPTRLTCRRAGKYLIIGTAAFATAAGGYRAGNIRLNGTTRLATVTTTPSGSWDFLNPSCIYDLAVGDYVEFTVYHTQGAALNINVQAARTPEFMMVRIG